MLKDLEILAADKKTTANTNQVRSTENQVFVNLAVEKTTSLEIRRGPWPRQRRPQCSGLNKMYVTKTNSTCQCSNKRKCARELEPSTQRC